MASKTKTTTTKEKTISLENVLWNCRVALRGVGTAEKNRDAVIALAFLKFASDKFEIAREILQNKYKDISEALEVALDSGEAYAQYNYFYLPEEAQWSYLVKNASANDIALKIDTAIKLTAENNALVTDALPIGLFSSLGADKSKLKSLIDNVNTIEKDRFHEDDLIGRVYEYFLQNFAASGTKEVGEFYTPASAVKLIAELVEPYKGVVYDPCCGSGGMFVQSLKFVESHQGSKDDISIVGQESQPETWKLAKMNLAIRGISHDFGLKAASTFTDDLHTHRNGKIDYIMANPPFNLKDWRAENGLLDDPRFINAGYSVMPPKSNANYAWILHMLSKLNPEHGIAGFLLANGALNGGGDELTLRKEILEQDRVEAIIVLPRNMFYTTDISVTLWILNMNKKAHEYHGRQLRDRTNEVLFVDLRTWNQNIEEIAIDKNKKNKNVTLSDEQIAKVKEIYHTWQSEGQIGYQDVPELCQGATLEQIREQDYSLAPSKYIKFVDHDLEIDFDKEMTRIQKEMHEIIKEEKVSQKLLIDAFKGIGYDIE